VVGGGGVRYPTKVEVSFRDHHTADAVVTAAPPQGVLDVYGLRGFAVQHYALDAAVRQKIQALAGRREAQARDAFDLCVLVPDAPAAALLDFLAKNLSPDQLQEARTRSLAISFDEYRGQVLEFLEEAERESQGTEGAWDEIRLRTEELVEAIQHRQRRE
jgi:hypothetical protein